MFLVTVYSIQNPYSKNVVNEHDENSGLFNFCGVPIFRGFRGGSDPSIPVPSDFL